ncbi:MAG: GNAT family N-acetyltransferase, partial [Candidatus Nanohaloarchaea archaeon]|nr:GNAT family N-acetyltransferase [Candidatus Nanohaloarchaea archaeon]
MNATIREYPPGDLDELARVMVPVWWDGPWQHVDEEESRAYIERDLDRDAEILVAADDGIIGFTWAYPLANREEPLPDDEDFWEQLDEPTAYIAELGVVPERREEGIGTALMERLLARISPDFGSAVLRTHPDVEPAIRLYEKLGFERTGFHDVDKPERVLL